MSDLDLSKLNDRNADLWTADGEPTIAAVQAIAGRKVTREEIRATGRMRNRATATKPVVNHSLEIASAALAVQEQIQKIAATKTRLRQERAAFREVFDEWMKIAPKPSVEDSIREHLRRTAAHAAAGNVAAPVEPKYHSKLDEVMSGGPRRGPRDVTGSVRRPARSVR